ncbi:MAG: hypothetical protein V7752_14535 [Halopseudomonas sp.]
MRALALIQYIIIRFFKCWDEGVSLLPNIKELIIVAGPSCAGKSYFIRQLKAGNRGIGSALGIDDPAAWTFLNYRDYWSHSNAYQSKVVLHYDFYGLFKNGEFRRLKELVEINDSVKIVTLCVPSRLLFKRAILRVPKEILSLFKVRVRNMSIRTRVYNQALKIYQYGNKGQVSTLYSLWFKQIEELGVVRDWLFDSRSGVKPEILDARSIDYKLLVE